MYEPTVGGAWFRWSALDRGEKWLVTISFLLFVVGMVLVAELTEFGHHAYDVGFHLGSGGQAAPAHAARAPAMDRLMTLGAVGAFAVAIALWVAFSRRQDELFNRVQNRAYGLGSLVTIGLLALWSAGERLALLPPVDLPSLFGLWLLIGAVVWMIDARRWWR